MHSMKRIGASAALALALSASAGYAKPPVAKHSPGVLARTALAAKTAMHRKATPAATAPAPKAMPSTKPPASIANTPGEHSAISIACSQKADAQGLHGDARRKFREKCKHGGT
jgi:hypothetical protein